jgi:hypothetical protein
MTFAFYSEELEFIACPLFYSKLKYINIFSVSLCLTKSSLDLKGNMPNFNTKSRLKLTIYVLAVTVTTSILQRETNADPVSSLRFVIASNMIFISFSNQRTNF